MEIIIFWILLCIIPTVIANKKGRSGCGFFLLSVVLSPIVGIIIALLVEDKIEKSKDRRIKELEEKVDQIQGNENNENKKKSIEFEKTVSACYKCLFLKNHKCKKTGYSLIKWSRGEYMIKNEMNPCDGRYFKQK
jgi:hypothetical protein